MSAQPVEPGAVMWSPDPVRQREASYTIEDVLALPDDAPRVELLDGVMVVVPSPTSNHQGIEFLLQRWLWDHVPSDLLVRARLGVALGFKRSAEPDVLVIQRYGHSLDAHYVQPEQVVIAAEVVSSGTKARDRFHKPAAYAAAGIRHYWRIEQDPVHVYAYELGSARSYQLVADSDTELVLERPFEIKLAIGDITP